MLLEMVAAVPGTRGGPYAPTSTASPASRLWLKRSVRLPPPAASVHPERVGPVNAAAPAASAAPATWPRPYTSVLAASARRAPTGRLSLGWMPPMKGVVSTGESAPVQ